MAKKIFSEIQIILIFASAVFAYDFAALREAMFQNNPELLTLQEEYRRSELDVKDAWAGLGPTIDMQVSGTYMLNPPVDAVYLNVDDIVNSVQWPSGVKPVSSGQYVKIYDGMENTLYSVQFTLTQPLFTWGKLENAISLYNQISKIKLTQLESKQQQLETELETRLISLKYLERINEIIREIHSKLTGGTEILQLSYVPFVKEYEFENKLKESREKDIKYKSTGTGPHKDDLIFLINGNDVRKYGSQGQQRTAALSLKLSEIELVKLVIKDTPVLLLDDVLSELDSNRQNFLINSIGDIQTVVTCTGLDEFINNRININKVFKVTNGNVSEEN